MHNLVFILFILQCERHKMFVEVVWIKNSKVFSLKFQKTVSWFLWNSHEIDSKYKFSLNLFREKFQWKFSFQFYFILTDLFRCFLAKLLTFFFPHSFCFERFYDFYEIPRWFLAFKLFFIFPFAFIQDLHKIHPKIFLSRLKIRKRFWSR